MEQNVRASQERYQITHAFKKAAARIAGGLEAPARAALESAIEHEPDKRIRSRLLGALDDLDRIERSSGLPKDFGQAILYQCARACITVTDLAREIDEHPSTLLGWTLGSRGAPDRFRGYPVVQKIENYFDLEPGSMWKLVRYCKPGTAGTIPADMWPVEIPANPKIRKAILARLPDDILARSEEERRAEFMRCYTLVLKIPKRRECKEPYRHNVHSWSLELKAEVADLVRLHNTSIEEAGDDWADSWWAPGTEDRFTNNLSRYFGVISSCRKAGPNIPLDQMSMAWMVVAKLAGETAKFAVNQRTPKGKARSKKTKFQPDEYKFVRFCRGQVVPGGWLRSRPDLAAKLVPVEGLLSAADCEKALADWEGVCDAAVKEYEFILNKMRKRLGPGSNPKLPAAPILNSDVDFHDHFQKKLAERAACSNPAAFGGAFQIRNFIFAAIGTQLFHRSRTLREMTWRLDNEGHLRKIGRSYLVVMPREQFKNGDGPVFEDEEFVTFELDDTHGLNNALDLYLEPQQGARKLLLNGRQSERLFIMYSKKTEQDADSAYSLARRTSEGFFAKEEGQPWQDVGYLGVHIHRQIGCTEVRQRTGSVKKAADALLITERVAERTYNWEPPSEKARATKNDRRR